MFSFLLSSYNKLYIWSLNVGLEQHFGHLPVFLGQTAVDLINPSELNMYYKVFFY